ncbi:HAD-IIA family hydrolase [Citricoccus nitrophenolicus]|uniref:HAD-IIA family hydrolase n=1 Tax=Citricoccus nitrophenolicus TaxID=863575 RepID=UPI0031EB5DFB
MVDPVFFGGHDAVLCDLDGVVYAGDEPIVGAVETLRELGGRGIGVAYVTNNASRSPQQVAGHLRGFGLDVSAGQVFGSATAGVDLLTEVLGVSDRPAKVLVVGSEFLRAEVERYGHQVVANAAERPDAVIQGFDPAVSWWDLAQASYAISAGAEWIATNTDLTIPRAEGIAPGNGALVEAVSRATGARPRAAGKPEPLLFLQAARALGARNPLVVGDRLDTDILGGNRAGFGTALVLTGVDTAATAAEAAPEQRPTWVIETLPALGGEPR